MTALADLQLVTEAAAARLLGCSRDVLKRRALAGMVPYTHDPDTGRRLYSIESIRAFQRRQGELAAEKVA